MKRSWLPLILLTLSACGGGVSSQYAFGRNGPRAFIIECDDATACWGEAARLCPYGFDPLHTATKTEPQRLANALDAAGSNMSGQSRTYYSKTTGQMLVECRPRPQVPQTRLVTADPKR